MTMKADYGPPKHAHSISEYHLFMQPSPFKLLDDEPEHDNVKMQSIGLHASK